MENYFKDTFPLEYCMMVASGYLHYDTKQLISGEDKDGVRKCWRKLRVQMRNPSQCFISWFLMVVPMDKSGSDFKSADVGKLLFGCQENSPINYCPFFFILYDSMKYIYIFSSYILSIH